MSSHGWAGGKINSAGVLPNFNPGAFVNQNSGTPPLSLTDQLLTALVRRLAPVQQQFGKVINLAAGASTTVNLNQMATNGIIATITSGQINMYNSSTVDPSQPPDYVFLAGTGTVYIPMPYNMYGQWTLIAGGVTACAGKVQFIAY